MNDIVNFNPIPLANKTQQARALMRDDSYHPQWRAAKGTETVIHVWFMNERPDYAIQRRY